MSDNVTDRMGIRTKAETVSTIFNVMSWAVLVVGAIAAVSLFVSGDGEGGFMAVGVLLMTAVAWANVSLATIVAGYIANRS